MKTFPLVFLLFLVPVVLRAQRVQVGFNAGPLVGHRLLRTDSEMFRKLFSEERAIVRYGVGADVALRVGADWQVGTGLLYAPRGFGLRVQINDVNGPLPEDAKIRYHFNYLDVPLWAKYRFGVRERQSLYALAGFNNSFFLRDRIVVRHSVAPSSGRHFDALRRYLPGAMMGLGMRRSINDKLLIEVGPQATLQLDNVFDGNLPLKRFLYTAGLTFRVAYDLSGSIPPVAE